MDDKRIIILIDDFKEFRDKAKGWFEALGHTVYDFEDARFGPMPKIESLSPEEKARVVIVSDDLMPKVSGQELARRCRRNNPEIPFMLWSSALPENAAAKIENVDYAMAKPKGSENTDMVREALARTLENYALRPHEPRSRRPMDHVNRPSEGRHIS